VRLTVRIDVNSRASEVAARGANFAADFALTFAEEAAKVARRNVSPGVGPGPHPHRTPHEDTGELAENIFVESERRGFLASARIYTPLARGAHLEYGWTTRAATHYRYPWCEPAVLEVKHQADQIARTTSRRWLSEDGRAYKGRVNPSAPSTATFFPESA
jgi:hypothetical protein